MSEKPNYRFMQGNEACAEGALAAGVRFCAGYPITPSTEIIEVLSRKLPKVGGSFIQMEDEIASMGAIIGASLTGAKSLTATSGPGFSLKQENIGFAVIAEVPCVIVNVMRTGPSTGLPTQTAQGDVMQARWGTHGDHPIIVLSPAYVREAYEMTVRAFNLAEKYMTPVILLMDEVIGHMRERVVLKDYSSEEIVSRKYPECAKEEYRPYGASEDKTPCLAPFGDGFRYHVTGLFHDEMGFPTADSAIVDVEMKRMHAKIDDNLADIVEWDERETQDADIVIVTYGSTARSAMEAINIAKQEGLKVGLFRLQTIWPFPAQQIAELTGRVKKILVPEQNFGQVLLEVQRNAHHDAQIVPVNQVNGDLITPDTILQAIREVSK